MCGSHSITAGLKSENWGKTLSRDLLEFCLNFWPAYLSNLNKDTMGEKDQWERPLLFKHAGLNSNSVCIYSLGTMDRCRQRNAGACWPPAYPGSVRDCLKGNKRENDKAGYQCPLGLCTLHTFVQTTYSWNTNISRVDTSLESTLLPVSNHSHLLVSSALKHCVWTVRLSCDKMWTQWGQDSIK